MLLFYRRASKFNHRLNQKKVSSYKIRKYLKMSRIKKKRIIFKTKPSVKPYILQRRQHEIGSLRKELEKTLATNRKLIFIDEAIFLVKDNRVKAWACAN